MRISVIGLGKIGLPLASKFASMGNTVIGVDLNSDLVDAVNAGSADIQGELGLHDLLSRCVNSKLLSASTSFEHAVGQSEVIVVVVPLIVDSQGVPDFASIDMATTQIGQYAKPGTLVIYETTLPLGTTRTRFAPSLEMNSGLEVGKHLFVAFSPERVSSGTVLRDLREYPKLVGGVDPKSNKKVKAFYEAALDFRERDDLVRPNGVWDLGSSDAAELAKLAETTYRDVNIGLANQFAAHAEENGLDIYTVIEACNSQPSSHIHSPGIAVGGHCIPVYPHMYLQGDAQATIVKAARIANKSVPIRMIERIIKSVGPIIGMRVAILGLAYRAGVKEHAFSGAIDLAKLIVEVGGQPLIHDPLYSDEELESLGFTPYSLGQDCDVVILQASHSEYKKLTAASFPGAKLFVDGRNSAPDTIRGSIQTLILGNGQNSQEFFKAQPSN